MSSLSHPYEALLGPSGRSEPPGPHAATQEGDDLYSSVMAKESAVLDLVRRMDETRREEALKSSDKIAPMVVAFAEGVSGYMARLLHYLSRGANEEALALVTSPDGMVYTGVLLLLVSLVLAFM